MASSRSEESVNLKHFQHLMVSQCWCVLQFCFGHFCLECLTDVIANVCLAINLFFGRCYCHLPFCGRCYTTRSDVLWCRCYYHMFYIMAKWFDMFGRCCCHWLFVTGVIVTDKYLMLLFWQMLCQVVITTVQLLQWAVKLPIADVVAIW